MAIASEIGYQVGVLYDTVPESSSFIGHESTTLIAPTPKTTSRIGFTSLQIGGASSGWSRFTTLANETLVIIPRHANQELRLGSQIVTGGAAGEPMRIYGSGGVDLGDGYWGGPITIVEGYYTGPPFSGRSTDVRYNSQEVFPSWDGEFDNSTSSFTYYETEAWEPSIDWYGIAQRRYTTGVDRGMLYVNDTANPNDPKPIGVPWSGLVSIEPAGNDGEVSKRYIDGQLYSVYVSPSDFTASLTAFTYPDEFERCLGNLDLDGHGFIAHGQYLDTFSMCYRTMDGDGSNHIDNYTLHFVYNCTAIDAGTSYATINDSPEAGTFSFEIHGVPESMSGVKPTSYFKISSRNRNKGLFQGLERALYGHRGTAPYLPQPNEILEYFQEES